MKEFFESSVGMLVVALTIVIGIIDIAWLHNPPFGYQYPAGQLSGEQRDKEKGASGSVGSERAPIEIECDPNCTVKHADDKGSRGKFARLLNKAIDDPLVLLTFVLAAANIILVIIGWWQVRGANKSSERQLRAYICLQSGSVEYVDEKMIVASSVFHNSGQTPGYHVMTWSKVAVDNFGALPFSPAPTVTARPNDPRSIIGPSSDAHLGPVTTPVTAIEMADIRVGERQSFTGDV